MGSLWAVHPAPLCSALVWGRPGAWFALSVLWLLTCNCFGESPGVGDTAASSPGCAHMLAHTPGTGTLPTPAPFPGIPPTPLSQCQFPILSRRPGISSFHPLEDGLKLHSNFLGAACTRTHAHMHTRTPSHTGSHPAGKSSTLYSATLTFNTGPAPLRPGGRD